MLWVLKRTVSLRRFFRAPKTHVLFDGLENNFNFTLIKFPYLDLWEVAHCTEFFVSLVKFTEVHV